MGWFITEGPRIKLWYDINRRILAYFNLQLYIGQVRSLYSDTWQL